MSMPGFTAETAIARTNGRYIGRQYGSRSSSASIFPQGCGFGKNILCNGWILGCLGCTAFFPSVPAMIACYAGCLGGMFAYCRDCIDLIDVPQNGGGGGVGGGGPPAGGTCFPNKCCWGPEGECTVCVPRNAACP